LCPDATLLNASTAPIKKTGEFIILHNSQNKISEMRKKAEIMGLLQDMMEDLQIKYHVRKIGIFGSYSKGKQTDKSDIDIVVEFDQPIGLMAFAHLKNFISD
jgi:predicted nucleotidyltransferase